MVVWNHPACQQTKNDGGDEDETDHSLREYSSGFADSRRSERG